MKNHTRLLLVSSLFVLVFTIFVLAAQVDFSSFLPLTKVSAAGEKELSGYAWSSNIGWIKFKDSSPRYGVTLLGSKFFGYAWSSNIGWISFYDNTGTPPSGNANDSGVRLLGNGNVEGWARACSVFAPGTCSPVPGTCLTEPNTGMRCNSERGGWDGWISMSGTSPAYGVTYDSTSGKLDNFTWGADVVGWIDFCNDPTEAGEDYCVTVDSLNVQCATDPSGPVNIGTSVNWNSSTQTDPSYQYSWSWNAGTPTSQSGVGLTRVARVENTPGSPITGTLTVTDNTTGKTGTGSCDIYVEDLNSLVLTVSVGGVANGGMVNANSPPVPETGSITGCTNTNSPCQATYALASPPNTVTLVAAANPNSNSPDPLNPVPYSFRWSGDANCQNNQSSCGVVMDGRKDVTVIFEDQFSAGVALKSNDRLEINFHNEGQSALSNIAVIESLNGAGKLCVESFNSLTSGRSIDNIITNPLDQVQCILNGLLVSCTGRSSRADCPIIDLDNSVTLQVLVPKKMIEILNHSPYLINLKIQGASGEINIPFEYRVRDIRP